ncbi:hypothetical protein O3P69_003438 [Scylla paramamosain]|uniref:Uncharacterized protein n=1 Tax=Scylla paramamosain TaxID=85552 RepID=A0AAW0UGN7_SCYPA
MDMVNCSIDTLSAVLDEVIEGDAPKHKPYNYLHHLSQNHSLIHIMQTVMKTCHRYRKQTSRGSFKKQRWRIAANRLLLAVESPNLLCYGVSSRIHPLDKSRVLKRLQHQNVMVKTRPAPGSSRAVRQVHPTKKTKNSVTNT